MKLRKPLILFLPPVRYSETVAEHLAEYVLGGEDDEFCYSGDGREQWDAPSCFLSCHELNIRCPAMSYPVPPGQGKDLPVIRAMLPRRNRFSRKAPGRSCAEQVIGANVDMVVVITDAESDYNPRRIERYLTLIRKRGQRPWYL